MPFFDAPVSTLEQQEEAETPEKSKGDNLKEKMSWGQEARPSGSSSMAGMTSRVLAPG